MGFKASEQLIGIHELYRPAEGEPEIDIVAVHGLGGHATQTWATSEKVCWLNHQDLLPKYMKRARVLAWGYNANVSTWSGKTTSTDRILQHSVTFVQQLEADRSLESAEQRPIIFLCHSLGGIIVKRALAYSASCTSPMKSHLHSIYTSTFGIVFFGTPHHGSSKAGLFASLQKITSLTIPKAALEMESSLVKALEEESEILQNITDQFAPLMRRFHIFFFWEQEKTDLKYTKDYIVVETSAAPIMPDTERCGISADHRGMCKFGKSSEQGFRTVVAALRRYSQEAPSVIKERWNHTNASLAESWRQDAIELLRGSQPLPAPVYGTQEAKRIEDWQIRVPSLSEDRREGIAEYIKS